MPKEMRPPRYLPKDCEAGTKLVTKGEYIGQTEGRFGPQFSFMELESGDHVILGGGALRWRVEQGHMVEGEVFDIIFDGKQKMLKGDFAGKDVNAFKFLKYEDSELPKEFLEKRAAGGSTPQPAAQPKSAVAEALDDLA
jgi:hypothetical protein